MKYARDYPGGVIPVQIAYDGIIRQESLDLMKKFIPEVSLPRIYKVIYESIALSFTRAVEYQDKRATANEESQRPAQVTEEVAAAPTPNEGRTDQAPVVEISSQAADSEEGAAHDG